MGKLFFFGIAFLMFISCKQEKDASLEQDVSGVGFNGNKLAPKVNLNPKTTAILKNWPEFNALEASFNALYKAKNKEDLSLVIEDLIEKQKLLEASTYPEIFNKPQIKSRQKVFKTYILKVKASLEYGTAIGKPVEEMVSAFNAYRNQFNVIVNSTLDTKLILDE